MKWSIADYDGIADWAIVPKAEAKKPAPKASPACLNCDQPNDYAADDNCEGGGWKCWSCRQDPWR